MLTELALSYRVSGSSMKKPVTLVILPALLIIAATASHLTAQGQPPMTACASVKDVPLVCDQQGPEDLVALPGGQWVIAGAYTGTGGINLVKVSDRTSTRLYPSPSAKHQYDAKAYPGCPG